MSKPNLVFMHGEDIFSLRAELERWRVMFIKKHGETNLEILDGSKSSIEEIAGTINSMPFLAEKRLIFLRDFMASKNAEELKKLIPILEKIPDTSVLLITESKSPDKRSAFFKWLNKEATVRVFKKPEGWNLIEWIKRRAEDKGAKIDNEVANYLLKKVGEDLWRLANEIHKLALFAGEKNIEKNMVDSLVSDNIEQSVFTMTDRLAKKDIAGALRTIRQLQAQGQKGQYIFAMIARQFRIMLEIKALSEEGLTNNMIAKKMNAHPYTVKMSIKQCRNFSHSQLRHNLKKLLEIDRRLKSGEMQLRSGEEDQYMLAIERVLLQYQ